MMATEEIGLGVLIASHMVAINEVNRDFCTQTTFRCRPSIERDSGDRATKLSLPPRGSQNRDGPLSRRVVSGDYWDEFGRLETDGQIQFRMVGCNRAIG